jgi:cobalt-zinc-cadmium efflux system protein
VLVGRDENCHERRRDLEVLLEHEFGIEHTTLQVDHAVEGAPLRFLKRDAKVPEH